MPMSDFVAGLRARVGTELLLLPAVTAVITHKDRFLTCRPARSTQWALIGGGIEPGETPMEALVREVREEIGVVPVIHGIVGAYGGPNLVIRYPNGDRAAYVTVAYACTIEDFSLVLDENEIAETRWSTIEEFASLDRQKWVDDVLNDAFDSKRAGGPTHGPHRRRASMGSRGRSTAMPRAARVSPRLRTKASASASGWSPR